jgi:hypothetical protein
MTTVNMIARMRYDDDLNGFVNEVVAVTDAELDSTPDEDEYDGFFDWVAWWEREPIPRADG